MKPSTLISLLALLLSASALIFVLLRPAPLDQKQLDAAVATALAQREREIVMTHAPHFRAMFAETGNFEGSENWAPETLEELFAPVLRLIQGVVEE